MLHRQKCLSIVSPVQIQPEPNITHVTLLGVIDIGETEFGGLSLCSAMVLSQCRNILLLKLSFAPDCIVGGGIRIETWRRQIFKIDVSNGGYR